MAAIPPAASEHPRAPESTARTQKAPGHGRRTHARTSDRSFDTLQASQRFLRPLYLLRAWLAPTILLALILGGTAYGINRLWSSGASFSASWATIGFFAGVAAVVMYAKPDIPVLGWLGFLVYEILVPLLLGLLSLVTWIVTYPAGWVLRQLFLFRGRQP